MFFFFLGQVINIMLPLTSQALHNTLYRKLGWASVRGKMLLCTSRQRRGYVGLCEPTGEPVEGRLVGVIPTKTSGWGKGR